MAYSRTYDWVTQEMFRKKMEIVDWDKCDFELRTLEEGK